MRTVVARVTGAPQDFIFQGLQLVFEDIENGKVLIHNEVHQGIEYKARSLAEQGWGGFAAGPDRSVRER